MQIAGNLYRIVRNLHGREMFCINQTEICTAEEEMFCIKQAEICTQTK